MLRDDDSPERGLRLLGACLKTTRVAAARDFGRTGEGASARASASPQRAVTTEPTQATDKGPAARRVFAEKAVWRRCSSVEDPPGVFSFVAPCHTALSPKTAPLVVFKQALTSAATFRKVPPSLRSAGAVQKRCFGVFCPLCGSLGSRWLGLAGLGRAWWGSIRGRAARRKTERVPAAAEVTSQICEFQNSNQRFHLPAPGAAENGIFAKRTQMDRFGGHKDFLI